MPRGKIDLQKVLASLNTPCPKCGHQITPAERNRVTWEEIECPKCDKWTTIPWLMGGRHGESEAGVCSLGAHLGHQHLDVFNLPSGYVGLAYARRERLGSYDWLVPREYGIEGLAYGV